MSSSWILSVGVIIVAVGIDLGTTFSVVGINKDGKVIIIEDSHGQRIFPSVVSYRQTGDVVVGYDALPYLTKDPASTIYNAKRFIGRSLEEVKDYAEEHPFRVVENEKISNFSKVAFEISGKNNIPYYVSPEQVGTEVLKFLLRLTSAYLGHNQVNKAVIAVPAKFDTKQRQATAEAYRQAGLKVVRVIEEPTAAAVAYKLHKKSSIHHILVYDFGGGTLDVSLLYVAQGAVSVYATDGDDTLGGSDFDHCLAHHLRQQVEMQTGHKVPNALPPSLLHSVAHKEEDFCTLPSLHTKAEQAKKTLTYSDTVSVSCVDTADEKAESVVTVLLTRAADFEQQCADLFDRALLPVTRLLNELEMSPEDVDEVVLVGGSTRIPRIKVLLREYFQKELNDHIDPDITVAYGAAAILD